MSPWEGPDPPYQKSASAFARRARCEAGETIPLIMTRRLTQMPSIAGPHPRSTLSAAPSVPERRYTDFVEAIPENDFGGNLRSTPGVGATVWDKVVGSPIVAVGQ